MFIVIIGYALILLFQVPQLVKKKYWKELKVFSIFFIISFVLSLLYSIGIHLPSPYKGIAYLIEAVLNLNY